MCEKTIAITGSSGFIGSALVRYYEPKARLRLIQRKNGVPTLEGMAGIPEVVSVDFMNDEMSKLGDTLNECDVLFHCAQSAGFGPEVAVKVLDRYQSANPHGKFVHLSSINVVIAELAEDPYTKLKAETERVLEESNARIPILVVRPSFVVSRTDAGNFSSFVIFVKRTGIAPVFVPGPYHHFLLIDDLVSILDRESAVLGDVGIKCVNVIGRDLMTMGNLMEKVVEGLPRRALIVRLPTRPVRFFLNRFPCALDYIERKRKFFNDTPYTVPERFQTIVAESDVKALDLHY
jgi:nucleoside-diphosphate-sugar epimerase